MLDTKTEYYCEFVPNIFLKKKRIHQIFGPSRIRMLLFLAQKISGPIFWIKSSDEKIFLHPDGISPWISPDRLIFTYAKNQIDKLWIIENIVESRSSKLIVANLNTAPDFSSIRRLNLAIKSNFPSINHPICILFTDSQIKITGVESRWFIKSVPSWNKFGDDPLNLTREKWIFKRTYCRANSSSNWIVTLQKNAIGNSSEKIKLESFKLA